MEGGALFNPGFLGTDFLWWVGQIVDDSVWRDNYLHGKFSDKDSTPGWGRRYKVRIIGLHDMGTAVIPDDQLPWANVMYPITAGGFQANSGVTPNLRQGNMVFGFFLDGKDQQVPVIMGVLGNNSQTTLSQKIGENNVTNEKSGSIAVSGYAEGKRSKGNHRYDPPDEDKTISQPGGGGPNATPKPGATNEGEAVHNVTASDVKRDEKLKEKIGLMKPDPDQVIPSAMKNIQIVIENMTKKIDKIMQTLQSYADAITSIKSPSDSRALLDLINSGMDESGLLTEGGKKKLDSITNSIGAAASTFDAIVNAKSDISLTIANMSKEISKFMKMIFDKVMEFVMKKLNEGLTKVVAALPSSMRFQFADMKQVFTELINCAYGKMTSDLVSNIIGAIEDTLDLDKVFDKAKENLANSVTDPSQTYTNPKVPMCYAEKLTANVMSRYKDSMDDTNNNLVNNLGSYLDDVNGMLAGVTNGVGDIQNAIPDIQGSISSALSFTNISLNVFGCELKPLEATSDFYTFGKGGDGQSPAQMPSSESLGEAITSGPQPKNPNVPKQVPYVEPTEDTGDVNWTFEIA